MLLHYGADIITDKATGTALLHDCAREGKVNIMEALVQEKIDLNIQDKMGNTAFHVSVTEEKVNVVKLLLSSNADADIVNINGKTIFIIEQDAGGSKSDDENIQILSLILENMKKININDEAVTTSFYWAVQKGHSKIIESFLRHGVNVNVQNSIGYTPLHVAASNNNEKIVEILLKIRLDIHHCMWLQATTMKKLWKFFWRMEQIFPSKPKMD
ncbi:Ankyrin repeats (3 copies) [Popillia japonica]|uniref:Ankyrin repeats (3 copies) n=1 Tax=Popillia japonica TaxID=7064 RepID=A0AAW1KI32_POPJA